MTDYFRPLLRMDTPRPHDALRVGWCWFDKVAVHSRGQEPRLIAASEVPASALKMITRARAPVASMKMERPRIMGILNVTPDSFSDGGDFQAPDHARAHALKMIAAGADILDIGGESTRPGAETVDNAREIARTSPVIAAIRAVTDVPISIDTRKADVAAGAVAAGAGLINDVAAMTFDPDMINVVARTQKPICLMHALGDPATMQNNPEYDDVLLDVYDFLAARIAVAEAAGIARDKIVVDPGIGFGKTLEHNLLLLRGLSLFHGLGCAILLGASRKKFIGTLGNAPDAKDRMAGSVAVALHGVATGVHFLRVHDTYETRQAVNLQMAMAEQ